MTSDMGEMFNEHKRQQKLRRESNRHTSAELLTVRGVPYESKNLGAHLVLQRGPHRIDFWPGTGLWHYHTPKGKTLKRRGVFRLLKQWDAIGASMAQQERMPDVTDPAEPALPTAAVTPDYLRDVPF